MPSATGAGTGPGAAGLDPPPIAFTDAARARWRGLVALYPVISQGLEGTSMASFEDLPDGDRWALSFYVGSLAFPESSQTSGGQIWDRDAPVPTAIPDLATLVAKTPAQLHRELGDGTAGPVTAFRPEEHRGGTGLVSTGRYRWS